MKAIADILTKLVLAFVLIIIMFYFLRPVIEIYGAIAGIWNYDPLISVLMLIVIPIVAIVASVGGIVGVFTGGHR